MLNARTHSKRARERKSERAREREREKENEKEPRKKRSVRIRKRDGTKNQQITEWQRIFMLKKKTAAKTMLMLNSK